MPDRPVAGGMFTRLKGEFLTVGLEDSTGHRVESPDRFHLIRAAANDGSFLLSIAPAGSLSQMMLRDTECPLGLADVRPVMFVCSS